jgi:hypothetical protein
LIPQETSAWRNLNTLFSSVNNLAQSFFRDAGTRHSRSALFAANAAHDCGICITTQSTQELPQRKQWCGLQRALKLFIAHLRVFAVVAMTSIQDARARTSAHIKAHVVFASHKRVCAKFARTF